MLRLRALKLIQAFRQPGGAEFVLFCNEVIRAVCLAGGIPQAEISTCSRTDAKDGGVDTRIGKGISGTDRFGYFGGPSVWQFKAADESNITEASVRKEVKKSHVKKCVESGDAYRMCVCAHIPDNKRQDLEAVLNSGLKAINLLAPEGKIINIDDIAAVANAFPAVVLAHRPEFSGLCTLFDRWRQNATAVTRVFIPNTSFATTQITVLAHVDFSNVVPDSVMTLQGLAGVGKTRVAYECLRSLPAASSMVLYTDNEDAAIELATLLANDEIASGVIVADECSVAAREQLSRKLVGCRNRVRCVCIDNSLQRVPTPAPELSVPKLTSSELQKILEANFEGVPPDRIRTYAHLADGFVRLAADMCHYDAQIAQAGAITPVANRVDLYYRDRLRTDARMRAVEAISLLRRVNTRARFQHISRFCAA